jgi:hypothetical protein
MGAGKPGTFHGIFAFQHLHASLKCYNIVFALLALTPSGIISIISDITAALNSKSNYDSTLYFVTVFDIPFECLPSNVRANKFPNHLSNNGIIPLKKNNHTLHIGVQKPTPGPLPTGPVLNL